jgi:hypothetical protein
MKEDGSLFVRRLPESDGYVYASAAAPSCHDGGVL